LTLIKGGKNGKSKNYKGIKKDKVESRRNRSQTNKNKKNGWSEVFEKVTYSSGPGDNIYVFE
jgi:hypothetical protein